MIARQCRSEGVVSDILVNTPRHAQAKRDTTDLRRVDVPDRLAVFLRAGLDDGSGHGVPVLECQTRADADENRVAVDVCIGGVRVDERGHQGAANHDQNSADGVVRCVAADGGEGPACQHDEEDEHEDVGKEADCGLQRCVAAGELEEERDVVEGDGEGGGRCGGDDKEEYEFAAGEELDGEDAVGLGGEDGKGLLKDVGDD